MGLGKSKICTVSCADFGNKIYKTLITWCLLGTWAKKYDARVCMFWIWKRKTLVQRRPMWRAGESTPTSKKRPWKNIENITSMVVGPKMNHFSDMACPGLGKSIFITSNIVDLGNQRASIA